MKRLPLVCLLLCAIGCAQSNAPTVPSDVTERIQRQVRAYFNIPPDVEIKVGTPGPSEFPGYETLPVTMSREGKSQKADFLLAKDGKTLFRLTKIDLTKDIFAENMGKINLADRPVRGNPDAKVTVVSFDDFECPFCSRMHATLMNEILPEYGDKVRIIYKDYPLPQQMHPWAQRAAIDANCLAKESGTAYWQLADYLHANQRSLPASPQSLPASDAELDRLTLDFGKKNGADANRLQACIKAQADSVVKASVAEGDKLGVSATPTLFINGEKIEGALDADTVRAALNRQLLAQGVQPPPPKATAPATAPGGAKPSPSTAPVQPGAASNSGNPLGGSGATQPASK